MFKYLSFLLIFFSALAYGQESGTQLGSTNPDRGTYARGFFDYSDPGAINIRISVWGFVRYPGKYLVPEYTTITDVLSFSGGPNEEANLDDVRLYRVFEDGKEQMIKINYNDLMWEDHLTSNYRRSIPKIQPNDILVVPGEPRYFFKDYFSMGLSIFSVLLAITNLVIALNRR
jgi:hypothetical protein